MTTLHNDQATYRKLTKDPINRITFKLNDLIKSWHDSDIINEYRYKQLHCTNGNLPRFGQPKIHKPNFPANHRVNIRKSFIERIFFLT